ncbi:conjugal transfer nickase/helicase domain-containing protein [Pseudomonas sp. CFBP 13710]|uniref:conjugal transfer nickase/helicase domain-containing protein n=1 Tax=Pseudomonas sp. CFBP 13710 TaxID=2775311 RepID=UPI00406D4976
MRLPRRFTGAATASTPVSLDPPAGSLENAREVSNAPSDNLGQVFLSWIKLGILSHKLILNDSKVKIHEVYGTVLLITPGIFERYAHEFPDISQRAVQVMEE